MTIFKTQSFQRYPAWRRLIAAKSLTLFGYRAYLFSRGTTIEPRGIT